MISLNRALLLSSALIILSSSHSGFSMEKLKEPTAPTSSSLRGFVELPYQFTKTLFEPFIQEVLSHL
jgi:hypothetical protein